MEIWENGPYKEIWIDTDEDGDGPSMMGLIHGDFGWLMYLRGQCDAGFSSRNPDYPDTDDCEMMDFLLSNGQLDYYPMSFILPIQKVMEALEYFEKNHKPPKFITWHNDSNDGVSLND